MNTAKTGKTKNTLPIGTLARDAVTGEVAPIVALLPGIDECYVLDFPARRVMRLRHELTPKS